MFNPGDTVVYRHHVCTVAKIRENYFEGKDYIELHTLYEKSMKLFVAVDEAKPPALRRIMTEGEALALIDSIVDVEPIDEQELPKASTATLAERRIKEEYDKHLKTFAPEDLIPIIKSVHERTTRRENAGRRITATDKRYFDLAEGLLCDELAASLHMDRENVHDFLVERIKKAEAKKRR